MSCPQNLKVTKRSNFSNYLFLLTNFFVIRHLSPQEFIICLVDPKASEKKVFEIYSILFLRASVAENRAWVVWVRAEYPNHLDYKGRNIHKL